MNPIYVNPATGHLLRVVDDALVDDAGGNFPIVGGIPRFCEVENYASSFGHQWNKFQGTQIDREGVGGEPSKVRFFAETGWRPEELAGLDILEVGSGAGRFSRVVLEATTANLYSVDYSSAIEANWRNNGAIAPDRLHLSQASIYDLPFPDGRFDKVVCLGVLQHTPDFEASISSLVRKARPDGEIVVDFYEIRGFWTKLNAKYLLRPVTRRMSQERLLSLIDRHADRLIAASRLLQRIGLGMLRRFLPVVDIYGTLPAGLSEDQLREWVVLDTFDMFSPAYDNPQRLKDVEKMFERAGATVRFAGHIDSAAVVRAVRRKTETGELSE
ncbi:MAG TPA: class I SAM-dependent methyltransferase [Sphingomicrobium sp.]|nr:class I SAM-dependent methyltransferase [Sphingomicrobium sp.]